MFYLLNLEFVLEHVFTYVPCRQVAQDGLPPHRMMSTESKNDDVPR
jgi:hypothetical protein